MNNMNKYRKLIVSDRESNQRLDNFLVDKWQISKSQVNKLIASHQIQLNGQIINKNGHFVNYDDEISYLPAKVDLVEKQLNPINTDLVIEIIYEDEYCLVINKPNHLLVYPTQFNESLTLASWLKQYFTNHKITDFHDDLRQGIIHRLDRDTTGLLLIAKSSEIYTLLSKQLEEHKIVRKYQCLVNHCFAQNLTKFKLSTTIGRSYQNKYKMQVNAKKDAKLAETIVSVIQNINNNYAWVECELITGRTHQVRVHMRYINHPIINDPLYGIEKKCTEYGQYLYCSHLSFIHPIYKTLIDLTLKLPQEFSDKIEELKKYA